MQQNNSMAFAKQVEMPPDFPEVLKEFTREILRHQPESIFDFGVKYFEQKVNHMDAAAGGSASEDELSVVPSLR
ncbi:unnamed protein product [Amoebophrya sp. A25]|nr:unnamed protein product [Amoebophrya sp. A25]|eukprot:GSA25T00021359001.1